MRVQVLVILAFPLREASVPALTPDFDLTAFSVSCDFRASLTVATADSQAPIRSYFCSVTVADSAPSVVFRAPSHASSHRA